ncbi:MULTISPECIES: NAD-dependent epimerase/dehydratase family protein [unclassified Streptomyces]|uniref:NAD-dependent epimerase/dehydratase family protein n=1 Tax=Streptomyces sp. R35 TaxID=3238630 RepID=A0AB39SG15_9ACTN
MRILILGGSVFLGRAFAEEATLRGHAVTVFNRGRSGPDVPGAEALRGDRENPADLERLAAAGPWDAVVDTCGFEPRPVGDSARALSGRADTYLFVSSFHAHSDWPAAPVDESAPRHVCGPDATPDEVPGNALKAGCERAVEKYFTGGTLILNPGLIVGPWENTGRLLWWLERAARGGEFLAPGRPEQPVQLIDARDVAAFGLDLLEQRATGRYLVTGPKDGATFGELLGRCAEVTGSGAEPVWADDDFLLDQGVGPWTELPLWAPDEPAMAGTWAVVPAKAEAAGLRRRPLAETVADTWRWLGERGPATGPYKQGETVLGIAPDKEQEVLLAWHARTGVR